MVQVRRDYVSTHSRLKAAGYQKISNTLIYNVSTHSRLKAAGSTLASVALIAFSFNTQPPEGGWSGTSFFPQHDSGVSTHSRLKAAGDSGLDSIHDKSVFQHTAA